MTIRLNREQIVRNSNMEARERLFRGPVFNYVCASCGAVNLDNPDTIVITDRNYRAGSVCNKCGKFNLSDYTIHY